MNGAVNLATVPNRPPATNTRWQNLSMEHDAKNPGPDPERLRLEGPWEEAVGKALGRKRPVGGWPKAKPADEETAPDEGVEKPD